MSDGGRGCEGEGSLAGLRRGELRERSSILLTVVLVVGLGLVSAATAEIHDSCEAAALSITVVGEISEEAQQYDLAINSTAGGEVTVPGEGSFAYDAGAVIDLEATPDAGYEFVSWTGDVDTIADGAAAETTITVDGDYSIMANFEEIHGSVDWVLIVGIIAAVVVVGLVIFLVRRRRTA